MIIDMKRDGSTLRQQIESTRRDLEERTELLEMAQMARTNEGLRDLLDRAIVYYKLLKEGR